MGLLYWIDGVPPGRLGILPRPRGSDALGADIAWLRSVGVDLLVSLLTPEETRDHGLEGEAAACAAAGIEFRSWPVPDRGVPASVAGARRFAAELSSAVDAGRGVAIHCFAGIGRSATLAACVLVLRGDPVERALERITAARRTQVPDTAEQLRWLRDFARGR